MTQTVYIGSGSPWSNPFKGQENALQQFEKHLELKVLNSEITIEQLVMLHGKAFEPSTENHIPVLKKAAAWAMKQKASEPVIPEPRQIFVFGSNLAGRHGAGAAKEAREKHGAIYGQGIGLQGNSYAIPTKDGRNGQDLKLPEATLPLQTIGQYVAEFLLYAQANPTLQFNVQRIGCGLAGYVDAQIAPLFQSAPSNCHLPQGWRELSQEQKQPEIALPKVAIIGTAGRDKSIPMNRQLWEWMVMDADKRLPKDCHLVSGGAAWADHIAVYLYLQKRVSQLTLHLPAPFNEDQCQFIGGYGTAGGAANYYHRKFSQAIREDSLFQLKLAIQMGASGTFEPEGSGYRAMFERNKRVAAEVEGLLAYTFGTGDIPADGGTLDTWNQCQAPSKLHVPLPR